MNNLDKEACKQRFKGVENFFRRMAFNLGNSPSQTEVKIISCIPIDVTDLQQKVLKLEKELEQAHNNNKESKNKSKPPPVQKGVCDPPAPKAVNVRNISVSVSKGISCRQSSVSLQIKRSPIQEGSTVSLVYPARDPMSDCRYCSTDISNHVSRHERPPDCRKNFFSKKRTFQKKKKAKTQLVYYAKTNDKTPFNNYGLSDVTSKYVPKENNSFNRSFLVDVLEKQYRLARNGISNLSEFSTPVCRDGFSSNNPTYPYESDACSCCHGQFQNIDHHMNNRLYFDNLPTCSTNYTDNKNAYYDSNLYDLVPVKEKAVKFRNDFEIVKRRDPKKQAAVKCWPESSRARNKIPPIIVNYHNAPQHALKNIPAHLRKRKVMKQDKMSTKRETQNMKDTEPSNICCVDFGEVYAKRITRDNHKVIFPSISPKKNDAGCLTNFINNTECQTNGSTTNPLPQDKTEMTLNQIKNILQSVLTEVKTSSKIENLPKPKKDAVVQNGQSQGNMFGSSQLLQSFTYTPYNSYIAACSRQMPSNQLPCHNLPPGSFKCMTHFPVLIQPNKHMCTNCFRNSAHITKSAQMKKAASAATNTEQHQYRSNETEMLIKEIYKSIALNIDAPQKDINTKDYNNHLRKIVYDSINVAEIKTDKESNVSKAISEIFRNTIPLESSVTRNTDTTLDANLASNTATNRSHLDTNRRYTNTVTDSCTQDNNSTLSESTVKEVNKIQIISEEQESDDEESDVNEGEETSSTDSDAGDVTIEVEESTQQKKAKKGLFSKMLKMFKPRERRRNKDHSKHQQHVTTEKQHQSRHQSDKESESDSDDYQTVYSHKVPSPKTVHKLIDIKSKPHSKVFYSKQSQKKLRSKSPEYQRRSPYMEQEYRRYWDENLMFHDTQIPRHSSMVRDTTPRSRKQVYYQNYEARSAMVEPRYVPLRSETTGVRHRYAEHPADVCGAHQVANPTYIRRNSNVRNQIVQHNQRSDNMKPSLVTSRSSRRRFSRVGPKGLAWLKKHNCGPDWKKFILES